MQSRKSASSRGKHSTSGKTSGPTTQVLTHVQQVQLLAALRNYFILNPPHEYIFHINWLISEHVECLADSKGGPDIADISHMLHHALATVSLISELASIAEWANADMHGGTTEM